MEVKTRFKETKARMIPEQWVVKRLGDLFQFRNGVNADKRAYGQGLRFINVLEPITYSHLYGPEIPGRVSIPPAVATAYMVKKGDVLFNRTSETDSELGLASVYLGQEAVVFGGFVIRGRPVDDSFDPVYAGYALRAPLIRSQIVPLGQGAVRANIGQERLSQVLAPVPPRPEQKAIAAALSNVDALLSGMDQLIAKKRDLKQATMQQLLTGRTRLRGFNGEWEVKKLEHHVQFLRNGVHSRADLTGDGSLKYLHYGDIHTSTRVVLNPAQVDMPSLPTHRGRSLERLRDGDVVFVDASEDLDGVGKSVEMKGVSCQEVVSGLHTIAARFDKAILADGYKAYLQFTPSFRTHLARLATGTKVYATSRAHIASAEIRLPGIREQTAIAAVLSDMDAELTALEARRNKTRALKQSMMQELLTGRTRLV